MKLCKSCGKEYSDNLEMCPEDGHPLSAIAEMPTAGSSSEQAQESVVISSAEQRFWDRMTFREFAILIVRLQALWILFPVLVELTYLPGYLSTIYPEQRFVLLPPDMKRSFYLALLRIALRSAVGVAAFIYAERLLSWLAKGLAKGERF
jgi:hypothetical protein